VRTGHIRKQEFSLNYWYWGLQPTNKRMNGQLMIFNIWSNNVIFLFKIYKFTSLGRTQFSKSPFDYNVYTVDYGLQLVHSLFG
jgi:hypothetical protein